MSQLPSYNPYQSPEPQQVFATSRTLPAAKPGYLTFLLVVSIVLGTLSVLRGGCVAASSLAGNPGRGARNQQNLPPAMQEMLAKYQQRGDAIDAKYSVFNKASIYLHALTGLVMVSGAIFLLNLHRPGDWILRAAYVFSLLISLVAMVPFTMHMLELQPLISEVSQISREATGDEAMAANVLLATFYGVMYGGICFGTLWLVLKLALFGHGIYYLGTPRVQSVLRSD